MDLGRKIVKEIYDAMMIDAEWSVREPRGFTWWGHRLAQRVTADVGRMDHGFEVFRIRLESDVLAGVPETMTVPAVLSALNGTGLMSAYVWNPQTGALSLVSTVYAHEGNAPFATRLAKGAVAIQAALAHLQAADLAKMLKAPLNASHHPASGKRPEPDDMLNAVALFASQGQSFSPYGPDVERVVDSLQSMGVLATESAEGLTAELEFTDGVPAALGGTGTALLDVSAVERHPRLGFGALITLKLPLSAPVELASAMAVRFNIAEADEFVRAPLLGGWCVAPVGGEVTYAAFLPAGLDAPGLLEHVTLSQALRATWAGAYIKRFVKDLVDRAS